MDRAGLVSGSKTMTSFFSRENQPVSRRSSITAWGFLGRTDMKLFTMTQKTTNSRGAVGTSNPCCCLRFSKLTTAASRQHVKKCQKPQLLISKETKTHSFAQVHHRQLHGSASAPSRRSCSHSRCHRRCRPATEMKPRHQRFQKRQLEKKRLSCEMTTVIVVAQQLDGVALHAVHLIAKVTLPMDW